MKRLILLLIALFIVLNIAIQIQDIKIQDEICGGMYLNEAKEIAVNKCGELKESYFCNENTNTWWVDLDLEREGCNPACVINVISKNAEINWRCTGLI